MSLTTKLTVTPLLYACGALLLLAIGLGVALKLEAGKVATAQADTRAAQAATTTVATERDAWKGRAETIGAANVAYGVAVTDLRAALAESQGENRRIDEAARSAIAAARAEAADADRTLAAFVTKYQRESRRAPCARALDAMAAACPALEGY